VFAEIARVLRPGGAVLVSDIVVEDLPPEILGIRQLHSSCVAGAISELAYVAGLREAGLVDVEVRERLVYEAVQLEAFIGSELKDSASSCCGPNLGTLARTWAPRLAGKIWSAKVFARKPA
jgi:arsenite methyltransferase